MLSYKFRLYPSKTAERALNRHMGLCRWLYNRLLSELKILQKGIKLKQTDTQAFIVDLKKEKPELGEVYSKVPPDSEPPALVQHPMRLARAEAERQD